MLRLLPSNPHLCLCDLCCAEKRTELTDRPIFQSTRTHDVTQVVGTMTDESERSADDNYHPPQLEHDSPTDGVKTSLSDESDTVVSGPVVEHQDDSTQAVTQDVADEKEDGGEGDENDPGDEDIEDDEDEDEDEDDDDDDEEEEEDEDEEPRFKYARLTQNMSGLYRNGDATSAFIVGGNKMVRSASDSHKTA